MAKTNIEWCDFTINPFVGCSKCSIGCQNCYAEKTAIRLSKNPQTASKYHGVIGPDNLWTGRVNFDPATLTQLQKLPKTHKRVFVGSMCDLFHPNVLYRDLDLLFATIALTPHLQYLVLTKRPDLMFKYFCDDRTNGDESIASGAIYDAAASDRQWRYFSSVPGWKTIKHVHPWQWPLPNLWLGVSVCVPNDIQKARLLLNIPAAGYFVSAEPLLGPVDFTSVPNPNGTVQNLLTGEVRVPGSYGNPQPPFHRKLGWVICGGETGSNARPSNPLWFRSLRDQCNKSGTPFFFKSHGEWGEVASPLSGDVWVLKDGSKIIPWSLDIQSASSHELEQIWPDWPMRKIGKEYAGNRLGTKLYQQFPAW